MFYVTDLQYFGRIDFIIALSSAQYCVFEQYVRPEKMGFSNRLTLAGAEGPLLLTIPLEKGRDQRSLIKDIRIVGGPGWKINHWRTMTSCYNRSPWFEYYRDELEKLYSGEERWLIDWDQKCLEWLLPKLEMKIEISRTEKFEKEYPGSESKDLRGKFHRNREEEKQTNPVRYRQVFEERTGFIPGLCILDLLFCEGPGAGEIVRKAGLGGSY